MSSAGLPWALSRGASVVVASLLVSACGAPLDQQGADDNVVELTLVLMDQYNTPVLLTVPSEPTLYRVSADVTLVFRFADQLDTLIVDVEDPQSGRVTHNEFDLAVVAPGIAAVTDGRWDLRVPLTIPELGVLQFSATLINHDGTMSRAIDGGFTVQASFGANNTTQTATTQVGIAIERSVH
jgi:hypothetical protein